MNSVIRAAAIGFCAISASAFVHQGTANRMAGTWEGEYSTANGTSGLVIRLGNANGAWSAAVRSASQVRPSNEFLPATDVRVRGDTMAFTLQWNTPVHWVGMVKGDSVTGTLSADYWSGTFRAKREKK